MKGIKMSWLEKLKFGMKKTARLFSFSQMDLSSQEAIEESLLQADVGVTTTQALLDEIKKQRPSDSAQLRAIMREQIVSKLSDIAKPLEINTTHKPFVVLMVGVNGAGKTTTIGKLGKLYQKKGYQVSFVAGDTFRAGAVEQLKKWGERASCTVFSAQNGADSAGLIYDALKSSRENKDDILFIDTAGRLHNRSDLMEELKKIGRVIQKIDNSAPHAVLLVLDATVGQNAIMQVQTFSQMIGVTGLIMTKLDGTAKGGILLALADKFQLPVHALGVGEQAEDLQPFTAEQYADSLLGTDE